MTSTLMRIDELASKWNSISPHKDGFLLVPVNSSVKFHIGYVNNSQKCFMILNTGKVDGLLSSKALTADCILLENNNEYALEFILNYPPLEDVFIKLCWDLMNASTESKDPVVGIVLRYKSWQKLLQTVSDEGMPFSAQKGLLGELLFLETSIDKLGVEDAIKAWVGPEGNDQDFLFANSWVEVKTAVVSADNVKISSVQQLDGSGEGQLVVYFLDKTSSDSVNAITLPIVVDRISCRLSDSLKDLFVCKLIKVGYLERDAEKYKGTKFLLGGVKRYRISSDFPRLIRGNIPVGISNAKYTISLQFIEEYKI